MSEAVELAGSDGAVATVRERTSRASQVVTLLAIVIPPLGLIIAAVGLWGVALSWVDVAVFLTLYVLTGLGTTVGYHRLFTHRSFETTKTVRATFAILGSMTIQGPVTQWVTDHRKHHALSDQDGDPHSPHAGFKPTAWGALKGFFHAHMGWLFHLKGMERGEHYGKDLYDDRLIRGIDRMYFVWVDAELRAAVRGRLRRRRCQLEARARGARLGWADSRLRLPARDVLGQLDLPHVRRAAATGRATRAATTGSSQR